MDYFFITEMGGLNLHDLEDMDEEQRIFWLGLISAIKLREEKEIKKAKKGKSFRGNRG